MRPFLGHPPPSVDLPMTLRNVSAAILCTVLGGCGSDSSPSLPDLGIAPSANADAGSSYENAKTDVWITYLSLPRPVGFRLRDAIAYLDADGDGDTDVFMGTGEYLLQGEVDSEMYISDGAGGFSFDQSVFGGSAPPRNTCAEVGGSGLQRRRAG